jgi:hypothetical protein
MHYIILRDDDTNALTPVDCLERLYRPFLDRGLPVNLATIPNVRTDARRADGQPEGFLLGRNGAQETHAWIGANRDLVTYLGQNPAYHVVQHGYDHSLYEFGHHDAGELAWRLDQGALLLAEAGFPPSPAFVAPYDRFSPQGLRVVARRFPVISTGWFKWSNLPPAWWPAYALKKLRQQPHWRSHRTTLLSHPGCLLSRYRPRGNILKEIRQTVAARRLTVLVTHWWEYFPGGRPDEEFIGQLHRVADQLAADPECQVVSFGDLAAGRTPWH